MADIQQLNTEYWYGWEERGRGWRVYEELVALEPPLEPFILPSITTQPYTDDGRVRDSIGTILKKGLGSLFTKKPEPKPTEEPEYYSYPDRPVPYVTTSPLCAYRVSLPKNQSVDTPETEKLLHILSGTTEPVSFEIIGVADGVIVQWVCHSIDADRLLANLRAYFPLVAIHEVEADVLPFPDTTPIAIGDLGLRDEFILPLETAKKYSPDPLISIVAALENLQYGESGMLQILFQGSNNPWSRVIMDMVTDGAGGSFFEDAPMLPKIAQSKVGNLLYGGVVRVIAQGQSKERSQQLFTSLSDAVITATRSEYNSLIVLPNGGYPFEQHLACVYKRSSCRLGMVLNASELATLVHMPSASVVSGKLVRNAIKSKPLPHALTDGHYALGVSTHLGKEELVWVTDQERLRHMHIIGATGTGKSTFIVNLALQDCDAGNGCIVFDPHGDLIDDILPRIGPERMGDVILIDPSDTEYPIGFNLLEAKTELEKIILSSDLVDTFKEKSTAWGDTMTAVLTNAINAFLESERGGTLLELRKFLLDNKFRNTVLAGIADPAIQSYWQQEFPQLKKGGLSPLLTRIDTFLRPKIIRNMMAQKVGLDFDGILAGNKIVLVKLSQGLIGRENSYMLGTLFLAKLYQAAQARQAVSKSERTPFYCYIDECQHYITPSLGEILSGARKYGLGLILAHQDLRQIQDTTIGNSILSNPAIRLCFRVGYADAQQLEKGFSFFDPTDLQNLSTGEAIGRVERNDWDFHMVGDILPDSVYEPDNAAIAKEQTRERYATPLADVEKVIAELYHYTPVETKEKKEVKEVKERYTEPKPEETTPVVEDTAVEESPRPVTPELPPVDIESASEKFREQAEKARQKREHLHMQDFIKKLAEQRGFKVVLEAPAQNGGRIDALLIRNELSIACELSVTNTIEYEVKNLQKCVDTGYEHIAMLCSNETHLRNIRQAAAEITNLQNVQFISPDHLYILLDSFEPKINTKETRTKGYRIRTTYNVESENQGTDEAVKATLREALKRKK